MRQGALQRDNAILTAIKVFGRGMILSCAPACIRLFLTRSERFRFRLHVILIVCMLVLTGCSRSSDEDRIRGAIRAMQESIEAAKPADFMRLVAEDFTADSGAVDRRALHNLLRLQVLGNAHIDIRLVSTGVELMDSRATVTVVAVFTGGNGRWLPERGSSWRIVSGWRKRDGDWQCITAEWEPLL